MSCTAEHATPTGSLPWERHHDLTRRQTEQYLSIGTTKFYELVKANILQTYRIGPDGRGAQRVVRESIEKLRNPGAQVSAPETRSTNR